MGAISFHFDHTAMGQKNLLPLKLTKHIQLKRYD